MLHIPINGFCYIVTSFFFLLNSSLNRKNINNNSITLCLSYTQHS
ncbi:hypothetical protein DJ62_3514 [Yersinia enterocolitica]|nr:hypothetical protein DJ61_2009 [Yersinia enterocolitica]KGA75477.1 hypothetical protein DJ62_3514 [Yersinia enterocolitica]